MLWCLVNLCSESKMLDNLKIPKGYSEAVIEEEQTTQEKGQNGKQRSTKHTEN